LTTDSDEDFRVTKQIKNYKEAWIQNRNRPEEWCCNQKVIIRSYNVEKR